MQLSNYKKLVLYFFIFNWFISFSKAALPPHILEQGIGLNQMLLGTGLTFVGILFFIILKFSNHLKARSSWIVATVGAFVYLLMIIKINSPMQFYLASFLYGSATYFFYIFYNPAHFQNTAKNNTGLSSAVMFSIGPVISILAPIMAGWLAQKNYIYLWLASGFFFLLTIYTVRWPQNFEIKYNLRAALAQIKSTRIFILLEGIWEAMIFAIIPVYTLFYIKNPAGYGFFLAYLGLVSLAANLFLGRLSDKLNKKLIFIYPVTILIALVTFSFPFGLNNLSVWFFLTGAISFLLPLFWSFFTALVADAHENLALSMAGRELVLTVGRITGIGLAYLGFTLEKTNYVFIFLGVIMLLFPAILYLNTKVFKKCVFN